MNLLLPQLSIKSRAALAGTLAVLLLFALFAAIEITRIRTDMKEILGAQQLTLISRIADELDNKIRATHGALIAAAAVTPPGSFANLAEMESWLHDQAGVRSLFDDAYLIGRNGKVLVDLPALGRRGIDVQDRDYFRRTMETRQPVISEPYMGRGLPEPTVMITAPVRSGNGEVAGMLAGAIHLLRPNIFGKLREGRIGTTGRFALIGRDRTVILSRDDEIIMTKGSAPGVSPLFDRVTSGREGWEDGTNTRGLHALFSYKPLTSVPWVLVGALPVQEAYGPIAAAEREAIVIAAMLSVVLAPLVWVGMLYLLSQIGTLRDAIHQIRANPDSQALVRMPRKDELGDLADDFNAMITERRQANVALRASEERYRSLAGLSADWYWEMDENFRFTSHQGSQPDTGSLPRSEGVIGKTRRELPFLHMTEAQWAAHQAQLEAHQAFRDFEVCRPDSNGNPTYAVISGAPFFAEDGAFRGYRGVGRDVTAVRAVEREAKIRQELESILLVMSSRFINAAENEIDSIVLDTLREIGEFAQADRCFVNLLDKQKQTYTLAYEWCAEGIDSKLASRQNVPVARTSLLWERLESNATMYMKVADLPSASPERAMLEASGIKSTLAVPVASGRKLLGCLAFDAVREVRHWGDDVVLLIRIAADIMGGIIARRTVEEALRASEEKFAKAFRLSPVYLCISTLAEGRYLEANEAMQRGIDRTHDGIVGHTATEIGMWKSLEDRNRAIELLEREGRVIGFEAELCKKSGATMPCEIWAERLEIDNVPCVLWIANDISLRKQAETEILQFNELLEQRVTMRTEELETAIKEMAAFSYSISHDLRAPLRSIVGFSQLLAESLQGQLNDENSHRLQRIVSNGSRMGLLIDEVLHYTRLARAELARRHVDLDSMVNEILTELRERYPGAQVKQYPLGQANADRTMIRQIFYNLIDNALKYSAMRAPSIIEIGASTTGDQVEYYVRDNGVGFDMSHAGHLFELFSRMHGVDEFEGIGAGLAIVKRLVERHKGHIHATAEVDKGATFSFSI